MIRLIIITNSMNYSTLNFVSCAFISKEGSGDYQTTTQILNAIENNANADDIFGILEF
ncbi:hypothetical protein [Methanococcoides sp. FTZ1]|uniref:hypothetical protein n=1 Tax=Methanococcoides sp. FTZ1 TaxID=3439061 RepID=UPI003F8757A7